MAVRDSLVQGMEALVYDVKASRYKRSQSGMVVSSGNERNG